MKEKIMTVSCNQTLQCNVHLNSSIFSRCLKQESDIDVVMLGGKLFHTRGPATPKAWLPMVKRRVSGTTSTDIDTERSR